MRHPEREGKRGFRATRGEKRDWLKGKWLHCEERVPSHTGERGKCLVKKGASGE